MYVYLLTVLIITKAMILYFDVQSINIQYNSKFQSYVISYLQCVCEFVAHAVMVHGHEGSVDDNAESYKEVHEGVKDEEFTELLPFHPAGAARPAAECGQEFTFQNLRFCFLHLVIFAGETYSTKLTSS